MQCVISTGILYSACTLPVNSDSTHRINARKHRGDGEKVVKFAVGLSKVPISVGCIHKIDQSVERGHRPVRKRQVEQKVIGDSSHAFVSQNDPHHDEIPEHCDPEDGAVRHGPQGDAPRRLHELVRQVPS